MTKGTEARLNATLTVGAITSKSILVVDDDRVVAKALNRLLSFESHQVESVGDGEAAIARYDDGGRYDLVITDYAMPGIDGLELARLIKERTPQKPVVLITAYLETVSGREKARLQHVDAVLGKPFSVEELNEALRALFPKEQALQAAARSATHA